MSIGPEYVGDQELPWLPGRHDGEPVRPDEVNVDYGDGRWSLTGMAAEHTLFSPVVLQLSGLPFDPVAVYWSEKGLPDGESPYWVDVGRQVLRGLPAPYDQVLFACPKSHAPGLIAFLDRLTISGGGVAIDSVRQRVPVVDWPLLRSIAVAPPNPPTVPVELYGVETDKFTLAWVPPHDPWRAPVSIVHRNKAAVKTDKQRFPGKVRR